MGVKAGPKVVKDGLIFALDAAVSRSYSGSGNTANGLIGGIGGTLVNGTGFSSINNGSFFFDGTNDYIDCGNILDSPADLTVIVWHTGSTFLRMLVAKLVNYNSGAGWAFYLETSRLTFLSQTNGSNYGYYYSTVQAIKSGWNHSVVTLVNQVPVAFYVSGIGYTVRPANVGTVTSISNSVNLRIGRDEANEYFFNGNIAQVSIYNRALSAQEVLQNYNATKGRYI
jgi:hypothetical protein